MDAGRSWRSAVVILVILYLEGDARLRAPMSQFIRRITGPIDLNIRPCKSGSDAIKQCDKDTDALLLIDSEGALTPQLVQSVASQIGATNHAFFMVQLMESWFLSDRPMLEAYYGRGFSPGSLPPNPNIENVPKPDVERGLHDATRRCRKGAYHKTTHAPDLLSQLNPATVYNACPNFARFIDYLRGDAAA